MTVYQWDQYDTYKNHNKLISEYYEAVHYCHERALHKLPLASGSKGLDIACGHGESTRLLTKFADSVIGVDSSTELIRLAREQEYPKQTEFICSTFQDYKYGDEKFDLVSGSWFLNHIHNEPDLKTTISKIKSLLKPGGCISFVVPGDSFTSRRVQQLALEEYQWEQAWIEEQPKSTHGVFRYNEESWIRTTIWQPMYLIRLFNKWFNLHTWDVKSTLVREKRLPELNMEPPFEIIYGQLRESEASR